MEKFKNHLDHLEGYFCVAALIAMSIIVFIQVIFRFIVKSSLPWSEEAARYLLVWTTFMGGAYGVRRGAHIGIEAFALILPQKAQKVLAIIVMVISALLCGAIFKFGLDIVISQLERGQLSPAMRIPMGYLYAAIPTGMVVFIIRYIQDIIHNITHFNDKPQEKEE